MNEPIKPDPGKEAPKPEQSDEDRPPVIQQYIDDLREIIRKFRKRFH
jgi:hypothetical protein